MPLKSWANPTREIISEISEKSKWLQVVINLQVKVLTWALIDDDPGSCADDCGRDTKSHVWPYIDAYSID